jgi:hypothetical protein
MFMLLWLGGAVAANAAITQGTWMLAELCGAWLWSDGGAVEVVAYFCSCCCGWGGPAAVNTLSHKAQGAWML